METRSEFDAIVFLDEKVFSVQQFVDKFNGCSYRKQKSTTCDGGSWNNVNNRTPLVFMSKRVKINATTYQQLVLEDCLKSCTYKA